MYESFFKVCVHLVVQTFGGMFNKFYINLNIFLLKNIYQSIHSFLSSHPAICLSIHQWSFHSVIQFCLQICKSSGGTCNTTIDGYYILIAFCFIYGFLWLIWRGNKLKYLDSLPLSAWKCSQPWRWWY